VVTVYIGVGGVFLGWLAGRSLPLTFALLGAVILVGAVTIRVDERHAVQPVFPFGEIMPK